MALFEAAMKMCDDCGRNDKPLTWSKDGNTRICADCKRQRGAREEEMEDGFLDLAEDRLDKNRRSSAHYDYKFGFADQAAQELLAHCRTLLKQNQELRTKLEGINKYIREGGWSG